MSERVCACGCEKPLDGLRKDALYLNDAHGREHRRERRRAREAGKGVYVPVKAHLRFLSK